MLLTALEAPDTASPLIVVYVIISSSILIYQRLDANLECTPEVSSKLVPLANVKVVAVALIAPFRVVVADDLTPEIVTLLDVAYIWLSEWFTFNTVLASVISSGSVPNVLEGTALFVKVTVPVWSNLARLIVNFKSSIGLIEKPVLWWDLYKTPTWGCSDTVLVPPTSVSPILEIHTLYFGEFEDNVIQYSTWSSTKTGESNVNVVAVAAVVDVLTSAGFLTTLLNGKVLVPGLPFTTFLISNVTGVLSSFDPK